jgi:hypothetical protein
MRYVRTAWALLLAAAILLPVGSADAQILPENHYKTYQTVGPTMTMPIGLRDQFGLYQVDQLVLDRFANPVDKNFEGIYDPMMHQTWWDLFIPTVTRLVTATDQFGQFQWTVHNARYLLLPALKNDPTGQPPPLWNHYLCYEAMGPAPQIIVTLEDQFGGIDTVVLEGIFFCNPVEKETPDGEIFPIIDPVVHLTCYLIDDPNPYGIPLTATDQFGQWSLDAGFSDCLCVPAFKDDVVGTEESTWGKIKGLYHK